MFRYIVWLFFIKLRREYSQKYLKLLRGTIVEITTFSIFLKNLQAILIMFFGGIIIIVPAIVLSFNGFFLGAFLDM